MPSETPTGRDPLRLLPPSELSPTDGDKEPLSTGDQTEALALSWDFQGGRHRTLEYKPSSVCSRWDPDTLLCFSHSPSSLQGPHSVVPPGRSDSWLVPSGGVCACSSLGFWHRCTGDDTRIPLPPPIQTESPACLPAELGFRPCELSRTSGLLPSLPLCSLSLGQPASPRSSSRSPPSWLPNAPPPLPVITQ